MSQHQMKRKKEKTIQERVKKLWDDFLQVFKYLSVKYPNIQVVEVLIYVCQILIFKQFSSTIKYSWSIWIQIKLRIIRFFTDNSVPIIYQVNIIFCI